MTKIKSDLNIQEQKNLVSLVVVSRNAKATIRRCLDSLTSQTYQNIEIIVVDSSEDGTQEILEEYKGKTALSFRIIHQEPRGVAVARNAGIENSSGEILVFVDSDCWIDRDFVEKIVLEFNKSENILTVYTDKIQLHPQGLFPNLVDLYERVMHYNDSLKVKSEKLSTFVVRKKLYNLIGVYNPQLKSGEDVELFNRLLQKKEELLEKGFKFVSVSGTNFYEEKQGLGFFEYYKRSIWYGKSLANFTYFKGNFSKNLMKLAFAGYYTLFLPFIILAVIANLNGIYFILASIPFSGLYIYIIIKSITIKKFRWLVLLMPILFFYKFIFLFIGFVEELLK